MEVKIKLGRNIFAVSDDDIVMDNGACVQLITKKIHKGWNCFIPIMSKKLFKQLLRVGFLYTNEDLKRLSVERYPHTELTLYKFNIPAMIKAGY